VQPGQHDAGCSGVERPSDPDPFRGLDAHQSGDAVASRSGDHVAHLLLATGTVLEVEQHPVEPGGRAHLGADRGGHADERSECRPASADCPGEGAAVEWRGAHPNHRWVSRPVSYSARSGGTVSISDTSAGATSHHTPAPGRSACGMASTTMTTVPWWPRVSFRASRRSVAVTARTARAPSPAATWTRSTDR